LVTLEHSSFANVRKGAQSHAQLHADNENKEDIKVMLWTIVAVLVVLWLLGFLLNVAGGIIHLLLVVALVVFVINLLRGRSTV
jgi:uncharacterized membrane protein